MPRVIWKGAISFGLVHVPVSLYPASQDSAIDFDWLDKRSMDPVGYKRINKRTGKDIERENIVKGVKVDDGDYVVLSDDEIKAAFPKTTQTIEIESFVKAAEIDFTLLEKPYYLEPIGKGERVYALLREAMADAGVIGIARVVMHNKEHLCALIAAGSALMLNTIRWSNEIRPPEELKLPAAGKEAHKLKPAELKMAAQLIGDMTNPWKPADYEDRFTSAVEALVQRKSDAGDTERVTPLEENVQAAVPSNVVDLTELLANSLAKRKNPAGIAGDPGAVKATGTKPASAKKAPARKAPAKRARA